MVDRNVIAASSTTGSRYHLPVMKGSPLKTMMVTFEKAATDIDTSVLRVMTGLQVEQIKNIRLENDALTGATDVDIGIYEGEGGPVVNKDYFADGLDISAGNVIMSGVIGMSAVPLSDRNKSVQEMAGVDKNYTMPVGGFDIALTGNTFGTAAGTINAIIDYV